MPGKVAASELFIRWRGECGSQEGVRGVVGPLSDCCRTVLEALWVVEEQGAGRVVRAFATPAALRSA